MVVLGTNSAFVIRQKQQEGFFAEELTKVLLSGSNKQPHACRRRLARFSHPHICPPKLPVNLEQHAESPLQQYLCPGHTHEAAVQCCAVIGPHIRG